jgi:hypothetical protein
MKTSGSILQTNYGNWMQHGDSLKENPVGFSTTHYNIRHSHRFRQPINTKTLIAIWGVLCQEHSALQDEHLATRLLQTGLWH